MRQFRKDMDWIWQYWNPKLEQWSTTIEISQPNNAIISSILTSWSLVQQNPATFMRHMQQKNSKAFRKSIQIVYWLSNNN